MKALALAPLLVLGHGEPIELVVAPHDRARRHALAEWVVPEGTLAPPFRLREGERDVPCQWKGVEGGFVVGWLVHALAAGEGRRYSLESGGSDTAEGVEFVPGDPRGIFARVRGATVARFFEGESLKPCAQLWLPDGRPLTRGFPLEPREGEPRDHPHQEALFVGHGDVNGRDYWSRLPIRGAGSIGMAIGPALGEMTTRLRWGDDLVEGRQVRVLDTGDDLVLDWTITLSAEGGPAVLGMKKEGTFAIRVADGLAEDRGGSIVNSDGRRGEEACRSAPAAWCDFSGEVGGRKMGVAILNHPESFRFPTDWHVRAYGLLSANPFLARESHRLEKGESITLRYRVYGHRGDATEGRVAEVYEAYAHPPRVHRP